MLTVLLISVTYAKIVKNKIRTTLTTHAQRDNLKDITITQCLHLLFIIVVVLFCLFICLFVYLKVTCI